MAIMDRDEFGANTDVLVVADSAREALLWVPRDLWCEVIHTRVNRAFAHGGHDRLAAALAEHGIEVQHSICVLPAAVRAGFEGVTVTMPVRERLDFWYPVEPDLPIEEGRKRISFEPPVASLRGERIDQWIGARYHLDGRQSDLERIGRQQELLAVLLGTGIDFTRFLEPGHAVRISGADALDELAQVRWSWNFETMSALEETRIEAQWVLRSSSSASFYRPG